MTLSPREELHQLIEKLPESKVEKLLDIAKKEDIASSNNNLLNNFESITNEDDWVFKELAK